IASFILSLTGFIPFIGSTLGIIFGIKALKRIKRQPEIRKGKAFAIAGIILSIIGLLWSINLLSYWISTGSVW
ncbi:MAG: DUF4190 domain-containing protein, partial [Bacteroidetes bacterium]|nr:DUF4190 domain-containing protein [Bacteroidota bacterium]